MQHIDIFDGKPAENAYLAPDDPDTAPNSYTVSAIYDQGRKLTVRCTYDGGVVVDVELKTKVQKCEYKDRHGTPSLVCK